MRAMAKSMNQLVAEFPAQMQEALDIATTFNLETTPDFQNVVICGLGGSGIGATILSQLIGSEGDKPIIVSKDYTIPAFVNKLSVVIACSYSGNTEETLEALDASMESGAQIMCITSGGKLLEMAKENAWPHIQIPGGYPPRSAFGFSSVQLFKLAECLGLVSSNWKKEMTLAMELIQRDQEAISKNAEVLAEQLVGKLPVIYSSNWLEGVGTRWRQQINENAKMLCWHHYYPEMNHNELVGWRNNDEKLAVLMLKSNLDHSRVAKRMELSETIYRKYTPNAHLIEAKGSTPIEQAIYLIHFGDWMSVHLADFRESDSTEVKVIDWLKGELSKF